MKLSSRRGQILVAVLCALLGFGVVLQVRNVRSDTPLQTARPDDLVRLLDSLDQRGQRLDDEILDLQETRDRLTSGKDSAAAARQELEKRKETLGILAGTIAATGPGVIVTFTGPANASLLLDTVQELRDAGAEAMQIGTVRVVASTSLVDGTDGSVIVDGTSLKSPIGIKAIGDPDTLATALKIPGGVIDTASADKVEVNVVTKPVVVVNALHSAQPPRYAQPTS